MKKYNTKNDGLPSTAGSSPIINEHRGISLIDEACRHLLTDESEGYYDDIRECHVLSVTYEPDGQIFEYYIAHGFVPGQKPEWNFEKCTRTIASWGDVISAHEAAKFLRERNIVIVGYYAE